MSGLADVLKNEYTGKLLDLTGVRKPPFVPDLNTKHYRAPLVEAGGGYMQLKKYAGPQIPASEWESLEYTTYKSDPFTFFAPITSPTGKIEMIGAAEVGKEELDCVPTPNAEKCPTIMAWLDSIGANYGRVQLLRMSPNTIRECRWGLHQDNNNMKNPDSNGWIVRVWHEFTNDATSRLLVRSERFNKKTEYQIPLPAGQQAVVDSERLWHGGAHSGTHTRYALIASFESSPALDDWIQAQLP